MEEKKSKFDRDNTLIWVLIGLLICITIQMVGVIHLKNDIKEKETNFLKLKKSLDECSEAIYWEQDARKQDIIESNRRKNN